jgi:hypothetical protein
MFGLFLLACGLGLNAAKRLSALADISVDIEGGYLTISMERGR